MTLDERVEKINFDAAGHLKQWIKKIDSGEVVGDDLLASLYGATVAAILFGYDPDSLLNDAKAGAERLINLLEKTESICANKDENGNCPLHNLHCTYPECEKKS